MMCTVPTSSTERAMFKVIDNLSINRVQCPARSVVVRAFDPSQVRSSEVGVKLRSDPGSISNAAEVQYNFRLVLILFASHIAR